MIVYRHIRLDKNEVFYIGIGKTLSRAYDKKSRNRHWNYIVNRTDYRVDILFEDLTRFEAKEKEMELIRLYGRKDLGLGTLVNMTDGGDGAFNLTVDIRDGISKKLKEYYQDKDAPMKGVKMSDESKKKMSEIAKKRVGEKNNFYGKKHQDDTRIKMSERHHRRTECIDTLTGKIYKSIKLVCLDLNMAKSTLLRKMKNPDYRIQKYKNR